MTNTNKEITYKQILGKKDFLPFYVYDFDLVKKQILKLKENLPSNVKLYYAAKANPNIAILRIMKNFGLAVEVSSLGEFLASNKAGLKPAQTLFAGSTKSDQELLIAIKKGIDLMSIESLPELQRLETIARRIGKKQNIILRLKLKMAFKKEDFSGRMLVRSFGLSLTEANEILDDFSKKFPHLNLKGFHVYEVTRLCDVDVLVKIVDQIFLIVQRLEKKFKLHLPIIDIGGGFGSTVRQELSVITFCQRLKKLIKQYNFNNREIILELGRYLINPAGTYLSRIIEVRKNKKTNFLIIEGIVNHLSTKISDHFGGEFSKLVESAIMKGDYNFGIELLPHLKGQIYPSVICGQLSSSSDILGQTTDCRFPLPQAKVGDLIVIRYVGAYGLTQAMTLFGSRPLASEFLLINNKLELIRDKMSAQDFISNQRIPSVLNIVN